MSGKIKPLSEQEKSQIEMLHAYLSKGGYTLDDLNTELYAIPKRCLEGEVTEKELKAIQGNFFKNAYKLIMDKEKAIELAHNMYVYETSEKADEKDQSFDSLWQSIYDVVQVASFGIIEDVEEDELEEAVQWLKDTKRFTKKYKDMEVDF